MLVESTEENFPYIRTSLPKVKIWVRGFAYIIRENLPLIIDIG
jgi:hypothetical protein